ncbi:MAG: type II secretion system minor pseudopilin GspK [Maricaulaceae bacterium]
MKRQSANQQDEGAVLLTTLLVMSLMAILAVAIMDDVRFAVKRSINMQNYAQADWYSYGLEDFAYSYLSTQTRAASAEQLNAVLMQDTPITLPVDGGVLSLNIRDGSQCFSLGALKDAPGRRQFRVLLTVLGWDASAAARQTSIAADWIDDDSQTLPNGAEDYVYLGRDVAHRTANTSFATIMEIRALEGMDEEKYQRLRPYLCARKQTEGAALNINTLSPQQAPLLTALLGDEGLYNTAIQLITARPAIGYENVEQLMNASLLEGESLVNANFDALTFKPEHIWVEAEIVYRQARRTMVLEYTISDNGIKRNFRRVGQEARRPILKEPVI